MRARTKARSFSRATVGLPSMLRELGLPRWLLLYGVVVPLAIFIGYLLATPLDFTSYTLVGMILMTLSIPLLLKYHYAWLIFAWNSWVAIYFLPGQPSFGV